MASLADVGQGIRGPTRIEPDGVAIVQHFLGANVEAPRQNPQARIEDSGLHGSNR
jgi:hypothetical protein